MRRLWRLRVEQLWQRHTILCWVGVIVGSLVLGFLLTSAGTGGWDEKAMYRYSLWLLSRYHLTGPVPPSMDPAIVDTMVLHHGSLWMLLLGICSELIFPWLNDPLWVRMAVNWSLFPITLFGTYALLRRAGVSRSQSALSVSCIFGIIRFGGHALVNTKDFPTAACVLLASIALWLLIRSFCLGASGRSTGRLALMGCVAILPFLLRPPLLPLFALLLCFLGTYALTIKGHLSWWEKVRWVAVPFVSGVIFLWLLYPALWTTDPSELLQPFGLFSSFPWSGFTRVLGITIDVPGVPRWYPFAWIIVITNGAVLFACLIGCFLPFFTRPASLSHECSLRSRFGVWNLSLYRWLWIVVIFTWGSLLLAGPTTLYDEERHLLFLYPILFLAASLGLHALRSTTKNILTIMLLISCSFSYWTWGKYAYVYKDPFTTMVHPDQFTGDYWGICLNDAVRALKRYAPSNARVVSGIPAVAAMQLSRLQSSLLWKESGYENFELVETSKKPYVRIQMRRGGFGDIDEQLRTGEARLLWQTTMPPGVPACLMVYYP